MKVESGNSGVPVRSTRRRSYRVALCGAGNIGSHLATQLATHDGLQRAYVIDRDIVEERNCVNQNYELGEIGRPKAEVTAERMRRMAPDVKVEAIVADLEDVPLGVFADVDVCLGGLDSLRARQVSANECAYPLGIPVVDGAVDGEGSWFGKVQVLVPGSACIECAWGREHYRQLAREMPCEPGGVSSGPPNRASALMGAAIAGLMFEQARRILGGADPQSSYEISIDLHHDRRVVSRLRLSSGCRFDHVIVRNSVALERPFAEASFDHLREAARAWSGDEDVQLEFRRMVFGDEAPLARWQSISSLAKLGTQRLSEMGLAPRDRIRLRTAGRHAFVVLDSHDSRLAGARP